LLDKPIAVLGGGNGAQTMAADLTLAGLKVYLYEHPSLAGSPRFAPVLQSAEIELDGIGRRGRARLARVTTRMEEALDGVTWINVASGTAKSWSSGPATTALSAWPNSCGNAGSRPRSSWPRPTPSPTALASRGPDRPTYS
jgi:hypothetical protein